MQIELDEIFTEQAEFLSQEMLSAWNVDHPKERLFLKKLSGQGAQLISGPRGCGKTTFLKKAYMQAINDKQNNSFPIYVNYKNSLKVEPVYKEKSGASNIFNMWLILKIYEGIYETIEIYNLNKLKIDLFDLTISEEDLKLNLESIETGNYEGVIADLSIINIDTLSNDLNHLSINSNNKRCILLLDDAAHAFSIQQQRDFFDFFRKIKSNKISPKAAVYPGITDLSPSFHIGHDAELLNVWLDPEDSEYLNFMKEVLSKRLPNEAFQNLNKNASVIDFICFAAFGIPRAALNIIRALSEENNNIKTSAATVRKAITENYENNYKIFTSLKAKMPMYQNFIEIGEGVYDNILTSIKEFNLRKEPENQALEIAIKKDMSPEFKRLFGFFEYTGLAMVKQSISKGEAGRFQRYLINYSALINSNSLIGTSNLNIAKYSIAFQKRPHNVFPRIQSEKLISTQDLKSGFELSLPPCSSCNHPRASETAKFCENCGSQLKVFSIYENVVKSSIKQLPISETMSQRIFENSSLRTVKDILLDENRVVLRSVQWIGEKRSAQYLAYAEEFIA